MEKGRRKIKIIVCPRYRALNKRVSGTVTRRAASVRIDGARLERRTKNDLFLFVILYDRIKNKIWLVRYYFKVSLSTILVGQFRLSGPGRRVSRR